MKKILLMICAIVFLSTISYAAENLDSQKYFIYNGFRQYPDEQTNKVSYSIKVEPDTKYNFELQYYYNNVSVDTCSKEVIISDDEMFKKVTCEIQKLGDGEYIFDATLDSPQTDYIKNIYEKEFIFQNASASMEFKEIGDKTQIIITIDGKHSDLTILNEIPKEVIAHLDNSNKDNLIESVRDYKIIEADPLIAWNVESTPAQINYTVNKKISLEDRKRFRVEITQTKSFTYVKYIMFALIVVIIALLLKPVFRKNAKKN